MGYLKIWSGNPEETYRELADSIHFAFSKDQEQWEQLHQGYGILFASAIVLPDNTLEERSLVNPKMFKKGQEYHILAECVNLAGEKTDPQQLLLWKTADFLEFEECGLTERSVYPEYETEEVGITEIPEELEERICRRWLPLQSVAVEVPESISISD